MIKSLVIKLKTIGNAFIARKTKFDVTTIKIQLKIM